MPINLDSFRNVATQNRGYISESKNSQVTGKLEHHGSGFFGTIGSFFSKPSAEGNAQVRKSLYNALKNDTTLRLSPEALKQAALDLGLTDTIASQKPLRDREVRQIIHKATTGALETEGKALANSIRVAQLTKECATQLKSLSPQAQARINNGIQSGAIPGSYELRNEFNNAVFQDLIDNGSFRDAMQSKIADFHFDEGQKTKIYERLQESIFSSFNLGGSYLTVTQCQENMQKRIQAFCEVYSKLSDGIDKMDISQEVKTCLMGHINSNPELVTYDINETLMEFSGTAKNLLLTLTSEPPAGEADILVALDTFQSVLATSEDKHLYFSDRFTMEQLGKIVTDIAFADLGASEAGAPPSLSLANKTALQSVFKQLNCMAAVSKNSIAGKNELMPPASISLRGSLKSMEGIGNMAALLKAVAFEMDNTLLTQPDDLAVPGGDARISAGADNTIHVGGKDYSLDLSDDFKKYVENKGIVFSISNPLETKYTGTYSQAFQDQILTTLRKDIASAGNDAHVNNAVNTSVRDFTRGGNGLTVNGTVIFMANEIYTGADATEKLKAIFTKDGVLNESMLRAATAFMHQGIMGAFESNELGSNHSPLNAVFTPKTGGIQDMNWDLTFHEDGSCTFDMVSRFQVEYVRIPTGDGYKMKAVNPEVNMFSRSVSLELKPRPDGQCELSFNRAPEFSLGIDKGYSFFEEPLNTFSQTSEAPQLYEFLDDETMAILEGKDEDAKARMMETLKGRIVSESNVFLMGRIGIPLATINTLNKNGLLPKETVNDLSSDDADTRLAAITAIKGSIARAIDNGLLPVSSLDTANMALKSVYSYLELKLLSQSANPALAQAVEKYMVACLVDLSAARKELQKDLAPILESEKKLAGPQVVLGALGFTDDMLAAIHDQLSKGDFDSMLNHIYAKDAGYETALNFIRDAANLQLMYETMEKSGIDVESQRSLEKLCQSLPFIPTSSQVKTIIESGPVVQSLLTELTKSPVHKEAMHAALAEFNSTLSYMILSMGNEKSDGTVTPLPSETKEAFIQSYMDFVPVFTGLDTLSSESSQLLQALASSISFLAENSKPVGSKEQLSGTAKSISDIAGTGLAMNALAKFFSIPSAPPIVMPANVTKLPSEIKELAQVLGISINNPSIPGTSDSGKFSKQFQQKFLKAITEDAVEQLRLLKGGEDIATLFNGVIKDAARCGTGYELGGKSLVSSWETGSDESLMKGFTEYFTTEYGLDTQAMAALGKLIQQACQGITLGIMTNEEGGPFSQFFMLREEHASNYSINRLEDGGYSIKMHYEEVPTMVESGTSLGMLASRESSHTNDISLQLHIIDGYPKFTFVEEPRFSYSIPEITAFPNSVTDEFSDEEKMQLANKHLLTPETIGLLNNPATSNQAIASLKEQILNKDDIEYLQKLGVNLNSTAIKNKADLFFTPEIRAQLHSSNPDDRDLALAVIISFIDTIKDNEITFEDSLLENSLRDFSQAERSLIANAPLSIVEPLLQQVRSGQKDIAALGISGLKAFVAEQRPAMGIEYLKCEGFTQEQIDILTQKENHDKLDRMLGHILSGSEYAEEALGILRCDANLLKDMPLEEEHEPIEIKPLLADVHVSVEEEPVSSPEDVIVPQEPLRTSIPSLDPDRRRNSESDVRTLMRHDGFAPVQTLGDGNCMIYSILVDMINTSPTFMEDFGFHADIASVRFRSDEIRQLEQIPVNERTPEQVDELRRLNQQLMISYTNDGFIGQNGIQMKLRQSIYNYITEAFTKDTYFRELLLRKIKTQIGIDPENKSSDEILVIPQLREIFNPENPAAASEFEFELFVELNGTTLDVREIWNQLAVDKAIMNNGAFLGKDLLPFVATIIGRPVTVYSTNEYMAADPVTYSTNMTTGEPLTGEPIAIRFIASENGRGAGHFEAAVKLY